MKLAHEVYYGSTLQPGTEIQRCNGIPLTNYAKLSIITTQYIKSRKVHKIPNFIKVNKSEEH